MAYGQGYQQRNNNYGGGYQQRGGYGQGGYNNNTGNQQQVPPLSPEDFINERIQVHQKFTEQIRAAGLDPADFTFAMGGWVTSYCLEAKRR